MYKASEKSIVVFYHADCIDGFTGAWAAWKKFGDKAEYVPSFFEEEPTVKGKEIYMIDFVFEKPAVVERLIRDNKRVTVIDHHISAKHLALSTYKPLFDLDHSGCVLAWQYFFPDKPIPKFLLNVEDNDLWRHKIKESQPFHKYIHLFDFDFKIWSKLIKDFDDPIKKKSMVEKGRVIEIYRGRVIKDTIKAGARLVTFEGYEVYAMSTNSYYVSGTGHELATMKPPFAILWWEMKTGEIKVSLRGVGDIDCSKIAQKYNGGGHKLSAGFVLPSIQDIPWKPV